MHMVVRATDCERFHAVLAGDPTHITPKERLYLRRNCLASPFGREDAMKQRAAKRVGHVDGHPSAISWHGFVRPYGASGFCRLRPTQGFAALHPGLLSTLPPGGIRSVHPRIRPALAIGRTS
jgi:hypothetical protein